MKDEFVEKYIICSEMEDKDAARAMAGARQLLAFERETSFRRSGMLKPFLLTTSGMFSYSHYS